MHATHADWYYILLDFFNLKFNYTVLSLSNFNTIVLENPYIATNGSHLSCVDMIKEYVATVCSRCISDNWPSLCDHIVFPRAPLNDLSQCIISYCSLFADGCLLYRRIDSLNDSEIRGEILQKDMCNLECLSCELLQFGWIYIRMKFWR